MKNKISLLAILIMFLLCGCYNTTEKDVSSSDAEAVLDSISSAELVMDSSAFCPSLLKEIKSFINKYGGFVVTIWIEDKGIDCYVLLSTSLFYHSGYMHGYQIIDGKMVVYSNNIIDGIWCDYKFLGKYQSTDSIEMRAESKCAEFLIDKSKLLTDLPSSFPEDPNGYPDENSWIAMNCIFEPQCKRLLVHSPDSLEVVFEGYY